MEASSHLLSPDDIFFFDEFQHITPLTSQLYTILQLLHNR